ncbi:nipped-B-like protein isoform X4 [Ambystoma mexicanum]|uniref:nipped-B-like protein isoform X4 n=1 Tax=Ambystoma mexicanum TaxID=8296 RepID=UPI0037E98F6B
MMNGDMPHVPITTLAGIASLTDLLNQLPLPSPLPATTTKSLLFNGRIAEEVNCLLACRDENLVSQLVHSLNQISTDCMYVLPLELKDNLGSDDPEGDIPVLLQAILARNPNVFREKRMLMPQYKLSQNSIHGSPASSNYQQTTISHSPSSRFVPPQTSSGNRFMTQQNSPVPSPYAPQSPAGYMPYSHPQSYTHPQMPQGSGSSPIVSGGMRNMHESKVSGPLSGNSANHHADNSRHGSGEDFMHIAHRLGSEDGDSSIRNPASFSLRSPQSVCSPTGSDGTPKGSRSSLILQSQPPPYSSPSDAPPDLLLDSPDRKQKKQKKLKMSKEEKEQSDKSAMYDIISSPSKDCTKLTLRLTRVRSSDMDQSDEMLSGIENSSVTEEDISFNLHYPGPTSKAPHSPQDANRPLNVDTCLSHEQTAFLQAQQVPVLQQNTAVAGKTQQTSLVQSQTLLQQGSITPYDEVELDALAEIERIERESAIERERFSKEVQDKDKPLKKRKQDSYPLEAGTATGGNKQATQETGNGSRPPLLVSIDLQQAGRVDSLTPETQDCDSTKKTEEIKECNDASACAPPGDPLLGLKPKLESHPDTPRNTSELGQLTGKLSENNQNEVKSESKEREIKCEAKHCVLNSEEKDSKSQCKQSENKNESIPNENKNESSPNENKSDNRLDRRKSDSRPDRRKSDSRPDRRKSDRPDRRKSDSMMQSDSKQECKSDNQQDRGGSNCKEDLSTIDDKMDISQAESKIEQKNSGSKASENKIDNIMEGVKFEAPVVETKRDNESGESNSIAKPEQVKSDCLLMQGNCDFTPEQEGDGELVQGQGDCERKQEGHSDSELKQGQGGCEPVRLKGGGKLCRGKQAQGKVGGKLDKGDGKPGKGDDKRDQDKGESNSDQGKIDGKPEPGKIDGKPEPGKIDGKPEPGKIDGKPEPGKIDGKPEPGKSDGEPDPGKSDGEPDPGKSDGEPDPGQSDGKPDPGQSDGKPDPGQSDGKPDPGQSDGKPDPGQSDGKPDPGQSDGKPDPGQSDGKPDPGQSDGKPDPGQSDGKPDPGQSDGKPDPGQSDGKPDPGKSGGKPDPGKSGGKPDPGKSGGKPDPGKSGGKPDPGKSGGKPDPGKNDGKGDDKSDNGKRRGKPDPGKSDGKGDDKSDNGKRGGKPDPGKSDSKGDDKSDNGKRGGKPDPGKSDSKGDDKSGNGKRGGKSDQGKGGCKREQSKGNDKEDQANDSSNTNESQSKESSTGRQELRPRPATPKQKTDGRPGTPKQKNETRSEKQKTEHRSINSKQKNEGQSDNPKVKNDNCPETPKQKSEKKSESAKLKSESRPETPKHKNDSRSETPKHRHENRRDSIKSSSEKRPEISKNKQDSKSESLRTRPESRSGTQKRQGSNGARRDHDYIEHKTEDRESDRHKIDQSRNKRPEMLRSSSRNEQDSKRGSKSEDSKSERSERVHRRESGDSKERPPSREQKQRPESPRIRSEGKGDSNKSRSEKPSLKSPSRDERKTDGNKVKADINKAKPDNKAEFPSYLLGGRSLKHFVIPKIKRDKDGNALQDNATEMEPMEVEKIGLVEDLNKGAKPVVVLQKLSLDEVQKLIKEREEKTRTSSKTNRNKLSKQGKGGIDRKVLNELPPELVEEIESNMPLWERVKMNKRKRATVNEKPKYAEISSDEDNDSEEAFESSRKKQKKNDDKAWEYEERSRRGSGDHRKSGNDGRRSKYRERSSEESDMEESPPPALSDVLSRMKKREKQKKRKAYEPKLTPEEMMDSSTFKRFTASIENILDNLEDMDFSAFGDDDEIPQEMLLGKHQLNELGSESAKIKAMGIMDKLATEKMVKVLSILEKNIQDGAKLSTSLNNNDSEDEDKLWRDLIMERVTKSADACLTAINIMTSPSMPKAVYIEDVIERIIQYTKFHLQNTLYPQYDPVYRVDHHGGLLSSKAKRAKGSTHKQRVIIMLYNKVCDIVISMSELLEIQLLTDTTILQISSMGITPFFVENVSELQLCAIKLVTAVFSRYEKHRQLILEEIFTSLARLPTSKRGLRNFRLNSSDTDGEPMYIQMVTALVLQLIQCVVHLPSDKDSNSEEETNKKVDQDVLITNSYETAMRTAQNFLSIFLKKCGSKQGEEDYRPLFENFVQDLLSTVNKPEWPAAELLLSLLGRLLVHQFSNKSTEMALRVASLDYLGTVAARLRKDAVTSKMDQGSIDRILKQAPRGKDEIQQLQKLLLDYLEENTETDPSLVFSRKFYIAQWFRDTTMETEKAMKTQKEEESSEGAHHTKEIESTGEIMQRAESRKKFLRNIIQTAPSQFSTLKMNSDTVDYDDACLIVRYLASMRPFAQSFDIYLTQILRVLGENAIAVRTKAMKCLSEVVAGDPSILARLDMQRGVHGRLMDNSTSVREAAVELLGRFVLCRPQLAEQYYEMLIERILDTGISVRKRVIKILRDICLEQPTFPKITEMCVKMIRRVNDEEGIKKLVNETFQKLWFTPTPQNDKEAMTRKILNITDVVATCRDTGYDWFEQLLQNLLKTEEDSSYKPVRKACTQLVDNLVEHILKYEESLADSDSKGVNSSCLVSCITTLFLFSKIRPQLMVKHAMTMQPYLTTKCSTQNDFMVICNVAKILELVVPLMEHPSETFLATIEEDLMKLIIKYGMTVVQHCVSCLGSVVNKVTQNYKFVWACFNRYYGAITKLKNQHQEDPNSTVLATNKPALLRSLFTVGALCRHFDFDQEDFKGNSKVNIRDKVLELLMYFTKHSDEEVQTKAIIGLGFSFIQHPILMFEVDVKNLYNNILSDKSCSVNLKIQVLKNLQTYLQEEDTRMQEADREWKKLSKQEDLKEMGDITSGMSSSIMQLYLKQVLDAFFHTQSTVRHFALNVIALTLNQGLIHPVQCVPYLIAMGTDPEPSMRNKADQQLVEIDKKYTGFIHMKAVAGIKMSFQVQQAINSNLNNIIRGFRQDESTSGLCSHLYSMIRGNRQHRRAFLISLLNLFDDAAKTEVNMLLYIADNLACFPYQTQEEPLFIMHHIDITLSVSGSNLLQSFKESMVKEKTKEKPKEKVKEKPKEKVKEKPKEKTKDKSKEKKSSSSEEDDIESENEEEAVRPRKTRKRTNSNSDSEDEEDLDNLMRCLPEDLALIDFANASQGILLLLMLKQHLKNLCGFSDSKIQKYSPSESAKVYDKTINRKAGVHFEPKQTMDFLRSDMAHTELDDTMKRIIAKQYLDFKLLMEHLDPDEEEEEGEVSASTDIRNKAITSLLGGGGGSPKPNPPPETEDEESEGEDKTGATAGLRKSKRLSDSSDLGAQMNETVEATDIIAICCPKYKDRPQIAKVMKKTNHGYSIQWMAGSYSGVWAEAKRRDGRKLVPWVDSIKESDIIYKKIVLTSANKLSNKVVQTLRTLYSAKDGTSS